jgi:transposase
MYQTPIKQTVQQLHLAGKSNREISRILKMSRNTVKAILAETTVDSVNDPTCKERGDDELIELIPLLLKSCRDNLVRVHEVLAEEYQQHIAYSTLTHLVRRCQLREGTTKRFGEYCFNPGDEMQHDTSPHKLLLDGKPVIAQCASLILGFSRTVFIQYYPCFTRFEAKVFLAEALTFMQGSCRRCIIDNTSVILAAGAGKYAVVAPEMVFLSRMFGFEFVAHAVNNPNRKGKIERPFYYAETNFLAGRTFSDWHDLNKQARSWCEDVANHKIKRELGMAPETAFIQEKPHLLMLPEVMPPIYKHIQRIADTTGYINVDSNRYSIPESHIGHTVEIYQYIDKIDAYYKNRLIASHQRIVGQRGKRSLIKEHHLGLWRKEKLLEISEAEKQLNGVNTILDAYLLQLKSHVRGRGTRTFKQLLNLKQLYPLAAFTTAIEQAARYGLYDMKRIETMILKLVRSDFFNL